MNPTQKPQQHRHSIARLYITAPNCMFWAYVASALLLLMGLFVLGSSVLVYRRYRYVADLPTSSVHGAALGLTEVKGRVTAAEEPFRSPFQEQPCVLCHYAFYGRLPEHGGWTPPRDMGTLGVPFYVEDGSGRILIRPEGAEIKLPHHLTAFSGDASRIQELPPEVTERYKARKQNGAWPDISGERATVAEAVYSLKDAPSSPPTGPSCGAEVRLEEGDEVYIIGHAQSLDSHTDGNSAPNGSTLFIGTPPGSEGAFARLFNTIPHLSAAYGSIFEIYAGREETLMAEHQREVKKGLAIGALLVVLSLISLLALLLHEGLI